MLIEIIVSITFTILTFICVALFYKYKYQAKIKKDFPDIFIELLNDNKSPRENICLVFFKETHDLYLLLRLCITNKSQNDGAIHNPKLFYSRYNEEPTSFSKIHKLSEENKKSVLDFFNDVEYLENDIDVPKEKRRYVGLMFLLDNYTEFTLQPFDMKISYEQYKDKTLIREMQFSVDMLNFINHSNYIEFAKFKENVKRADEELAKYCEKKLKDLFG